MKFKTKKELAERLMNGERWRVMGNRSWCSYNEMYENPFFLDTYDWNDCDGKTEWEQDIPKKTITIEKWLLTGNGVYFVVEGDKEYIKLSNRKVKLLDSYEVEIEGE